MLRCGRVLEGRVYKLPGRFQEEEERRHSGADPVLVTLGHYQGHDPRLACLITSCFYRVYLYALCYDGETLDGCVQKLNGLLSERTLRS